MTKILEIISDRRGKLSIYKTLFLIGSLTFLGGWIYALNKNIPVPEMPQSIGVFLAILGTTQLGRSFLANQENKPKVIVNDTITK